MNLYVQSCLCVRGTGILGEVVSFTTFHLFLLLCCAIVVVGADLAALLQPHELQVILQQPHTGTAILQVRERDACGPVTLCMHPCADMRVQRAPWAEAHVDIIRHSQSCVCLRPLGFV